MAHHMTNLLPDRWTPTYIDLDNDSQYGQGCSRLSEDLADISHIRDCQCQPDLQLVGSGPIDMDY